MGQNIRLNRGVSRVASSTLDLLTSEERRCLDLSVLQISVLRQMVYPWATLPERLVEDHGEYQTIVVPPQAYTDALEELEVLLSGAYDGPIGGCPVADKYVDRGDLPGSDFTLAGLTKDGAFHSLDLTNVVGDALATRVLMRVVITATVAGSYAMFREDGNTSDYNVLAPRVQVAGGYMDAEGEILLSGAQKIAYKITNNVSELYLIVRGFWKPA